MNFIIRSRWLNGERHDIFTIQVKKTPVQTIARAKMARIHLRKVHSSETNYVYNIIARQGPYLGLFLALSRFEHTQGCESDGKFDTYDQSATPISRSKMVCLFFFTSYE